MKYNLVALMVLSLVLAGCSDTGDDGGSGSDMVALTINVDENGWQGKTVNVTTRSGETIDGLKAAHDNGGGFGIYGVGLLGPNTQRLVLWNSSIGQWDAGERIYWKRTADADDTFLIYAYAPYKSDPYTFSPYTGTLTFPADAADGKNTDLLYASATVKKSDGLAELNFKHAMAQISFGTITNNTSDAVTLSSVSLTGNLYASGTINTTNGTWSGQTYYDPTSKTFEFERTGLDLAISSGGIQALSIDPFILIPGPEVTITLTFSTGDTSSFTTTLEQGKNKTYNITVDKNFEVVITN